MTIPELETEAVRITTERLASTTAEIDSLEAWSTELTEKLSHAYASGGTAAEIEALREERDALERRLRLLKREVDGIQEAHSRAVDEATREYLHQVFDPGIERAEAIGRRLEALSVEVAELVEEYEREFGAAEAVRRRVKFSMGTRAAALLPGTLFQATGLYPAFLSECIAIRNLARRGLVRRLPPAPRPETPPRTTWRTPIGPLPRFFRTEAGRGA